MARGRTRHSLAALAALAASSLLLAFAAPARAETTLAVTTTSDTEHGSCQTTGVGECSLRELLEYVHWGDLSGAVRIVLAVEGTIELEASGLEIRFSDDVSSVAIEGPGAEELTIDGGGQYQHFFVPPNDSGEIAISGLTLAHGGGSESGGGAIYQEGGDLLLEDVNLERNSPEAGLTGGAIFVDGGNLTIASSKLSENEARSDLLGLSGGSGGALVVDAHSGDEVTIVESQITANKAEGYGGGIDHDEGKLRVVRSTIAANEAEEAGGGIWAHGAALVVEDSTVGANVAGKEAGGIQVEDSGDALIEGSTIAANTGLGLYEDSSDLRVASTVVSGNESGDTAADCAGEVDSAGHNLVEEPGAECTWEGAGSDQLGVDPLLGPLAENGGPTPTFAPVSAASPAINQGSHPAPADQRGRPRPVPTGIANTDVGAVEVQAPVNESLAPPEILGEVTLGSTLTCDPGGWDNDTVTDPSYSYAWLADGLPAGTGATHLLEASDTGAQLLCRVSVDNGAVAVTADTEPVELLPAAIELTPTTLAFGARKAGSGPSPSQTATLTNTGGASVLVSAVASSDPAHFPVDAGACAGGAVELEPGGACAIAVRFDPAAALEYGASLEVQSSAGNASAPLSGEGTEAKLVLSPAGFDFGSREAGTGPGPEKSFKVSNAGNVPAAIGAVTIAGADPGDFQISPGGDDCGATTLAPGGRCTVEVSFAPTATGSREARLELGGEAPASIPLRGTGVAPPAPPGPTPPPPVLTVVGAHRDGSKLVLALRCSSAEPRCPGRVTIRPAAGDGRVAAATVSPPRGTARVRLPLTRSGHRLLEADPRALLEARTAAYRATGGKTWRTRYLRLARGSSELRKGIGSTGAPPP